MSFIIGLTGGIGCGKSTVAAFFSELDVAIIDADMVAREVVEKGQPALLAIEQQFGSQILKCGELNRALLRDIIFNDSEQKNWLDKLLHPLIRSRIEERLAQAKGHYVILEAPLLFENNLDKLTDYNLVVDIAPDLQLQRASRRDGVSKEQIKAIIKTQLSRQQRLDKADFVIDNNSDSPNVLRNAINNLDKQFKRLKK